MQSESETARVDPSVQNELKQGEQLLWWGKPDPAHTVRNNTIRYTNIAIRIGLTIFTLILIFVVLNLFNIENDLGEGTQISTIFLLFICILLFSLSLARFFQYLRQFQRNITNLRHTTYAITDQRIIVITATNKNYGVKSHTRGDIGQIIRSETGAGWGDVSYGVPRSQQSGSRSITVVDKLAGIPNARGVEDILMRTFKNDQQPQQAWYAPQPAPMQAQPYSPDQPYPSYPPMPQHTMQPELPYPPLPQHYMQPAQPTQPPITQE